MKKIILTALSILSLHTLQAQSLSLDFPHFAGQEWTLTTFRGEGKDTVATGQLDGSGKAKIVFPPTYKNYRGMAQWFLKSGGGLTVIVSGGENISVSCNEAQPSEETIVYSNTPENIYLNSHFKQQQTILSKMEAMRMATTVYKDDTSPLLSTFTDELRKQEQDYQRFQEQTSQSSLYAADFSQITDVTRGLPPKLSSDRQENERLLKTFILDQLDMQALYTSGHWHGVISTWLDWYTYNPENETLLITDYPILKKRITDKEVQEAFDVTTKKILTDKKRDDLVHLTRTTKAPALTQVKLPAKKTILVFYSSGCGPCETEMQQLKGNYASLQSKGYEVITISADTDKDIFRNISESFPWKDKYCDYQGIAGKDFISYGVRGTPTFFLIDEKGMITGIYARLQDMKL